MTSRPKLARAKGDKKHAVVQVDEQGVSFIDFGAPSPHASALDKLKYANAQKFRQGKRASIDAGFTPEAAGLTPAQFEKLPP